MSRSRFTRGPGLWRVALLAFALVGLTQCRLVTDRLTGADAQLLGRSGARDCMVACREVMQEAIVDEARRHRARIRLCDPGDVDCLLAENQRHQAAVQAIQDAFQQCLQSCHHQGGGSGGD